MNEHYGKKEAGFTLIEITMVLVLLGILAAIAAPKYFDLQKAAERNAANQAIAEAEARSEATFAQQLLQGQSCSAARVKAIDWDSMQDSAGSNGHVYGDYELTFNPATPTSAAEYVTVDAYRKGSSESLGLSIKMPLPTCGGADELYKQAASTALENAKKLPSGLVFYADGSTNLRYRYTLDTSDNGSINGLLSYADNKNGNYPSETTHLLWNMVKDSVDNYHATSFTLKDGNGTIVTVSNIVQTTDNPWKSESGQTGMSTAFESYNFDLKVTDSTGTYIYKVDTTNSNFGITAVKN